MAKQAYGYIRVSSRGQQSGHGPERQRELIAEYARKARIEIADWFQDAHTGTEGDRPQFMEMLARMMDNGVKVVIVESLDRLARDLMIQSMLLAKLEAEGITLISASTGDDVTASMRDDPMRKAMVQIQGVFAELDKSLLVRKLRKAREAKREQEGRCEGQKPFGELPGESEVLDKIREYRKTPSTRKRSWAKVAARLNAERVLTRAGSEWTRQNLQQVASRAGIR